MTIRVRHRAGHAVADRIGDHDHRARLGVTGQLVLGVVRDFRSRRAGVNGKAPVAVCLRAFVARRVHRRDRQVVGGAVRHILLRRPAPLAVRLHRCAADELAVVIDVDVIDVGGCVAGEGRPCVVGDRAAGNLAGDRTDVVGQGDAVDHQARGLVIRRRAVCRAVDHNAVAVARLVGGFHHDVFGVHARRIRLDAPVTVRVRHRAGHAVADRIGDHDHRARLGVTGQLVLGVVRDFRSRRAGVNGKAPVTVCLRAFVARRVHRRNRQVVRGAVRHILLRRPAPLAVRLHRCAADELAVVIDIDVIDVGGCVAGKSRPRVIGDRAAGNFAGDRTDVVRQGDAVDDQA
ncbi:hypothetical protein FB99_43930 (plasmid) [Pantoea agglomerans]|nr:hypothetical protein FB99_43930 [Pantoea agglomerans]